MSARDGEGPTPTPEAAREEVRRELDEAKKAAPVFAGDVALVRVDSLCQVHPLVAQIRRTRLPKYVVITALGFPESVFARER